MASGVGRASPLICSKAPYLRAQSHDDETVPVDGLDGSDSVSETSSRELSRESFKKGVNPSNPSTKE